MQKFVALFGILLLSACGLYWTYAGPEVDAYDGPRRDDQDVASIDQEVSCIFESCVVLVRKGELILFSIENHSAQGFDTPNKIRLLPGEYQIRLEYKYEYRTSAFGELGSKRTSAFGEVSLSPGRTYNVVTDECTTCGVSAKPFVWMEEAGSGEVVLGESLEQAQKRVRKQYRIRQ